MNGKHLLYMDQLGNHFFARSVKDLRQQIGGGKSRVTKMFQDRKDGPTVHVGYVIGRHWLKMFEPVMLPVHN